jgi:putative ubiquitin-RnfH superfamily antitoxin RatB of RatAB toxin-antitoxin module
MSGQGQKRCVVAYATRDRQYLWAVDVPMDASIAEVIEAARQLADEPDVPWETAPVGIFGEVRERSHVPAEGDRVEIYRPLQTDPRDRRRDSVQGQRKAGKPRSGS